MIMLHFNLLCFSIGVFNSKLKNVEVVFVLFKYSQGTTLPLISVDFLCVIDFQDPLHVLIDRSADFQSW